MKKIITVVIGILFALSIMFAIMFAEYRYIMRNIKIYIGEDNTVYLEVFEQIDEYYIDGQYEELMED